MPVWGGGGGGGVKPVIWGLGGGGASVKPVLDIHVVGPNNGAHIPLIQSHSFHAHTLDSFTHMRSIHSLHSVHSHHTIL